MKYKKFVILDHVSLIDIISCVSIIHKLLLNVGYKLDVDDRMKIWFLHLQIENIFVCIAITQDKLIIVYIVQMTLNDSVTDQRST